MYDGIMDDGYGTYDPGHYCYTKRQLRKRNAPKGVHISNKSEGKVLRRLQSQTKLSEAEIRSIPKYNKMLSEAQMLPQLKSFAKVAKKIRLKTAAKLQLAIEHPQAIDLSEIELRKYFQTQIRFQKEKPIRDAELKRERENAQRLRDIQFQKNQLLIERLKSFYYE